jgi:hypothetical protein
MINKSWTDKEINILKKKYESNPLKYFCELFPYRTKRSIIHKANRLGLHQNEVNHEGQIINNIEFIEKLHKNKHGRHIYLCKCFCGNLFKVQYGEINKQYIKSCGCIIPERNRLNAQAKMIPKNYEESLEYLYPEIALEWDYNKNKCKPNEIRFASHIKVWWICNKCKYNWKTSIDCRTKGKTNCPKCNESKGEKKIAEILDSLNVKYEKRKWFKECRNINPLPFDFYFPQFNLCIEFQGSQHYIGWKTKDPNRTLNNLEEIQKHDRIKQHFCETNNIHLITIPYTEFNNLNIIIPNIVRSYTEPVMGILL